MKNFIIAVSVILVIVILVFFVIPFQYTATEHRISRIPYQFPQQNCVGYSFWSGACNQWQTVVVTQYQESNQDVKVTKSSSLFNIMTNRVQWYYEVRS